MTQVFVFGSNLAGRHGKGAALHAKKYYGAVYGQGVGMSPSSGPLGYSYAIPTKGIGNPMPTLPLSEIKVHVHNFLNFAIEHSDLTFNVTPIGCGLAGYSSKDILPLFLSWCFNDDGARFLPDNVYLPDEFLTLMGK